MIPVKPRPEPADFDEKVRTPGKDFLSRVPKPTTKQFNSHRYWKEAARQLYDSYGRVCAYCCLWIPACTGGSTVEHFRAKTTYPSEAYEWNNYRLVTAKLNSRKGTKEDVLDPFAIQSGWFVLEFPSLLVRPSSKITKQTAASVQATINRLRLNDDETCVEERADWLRQYCVFTVGGNEPDAFKYLKMQAPFIALELERQSLRGTITKCF